MTFEVNCGDLGVRNCDYVAVGETPEDVVEQMVKHLRAEHDIDMPDKDVILKGGTFLEEYDRGAEVIVKRLREELELDTESTTDVSDTPGPPVSGRAASG